MAFVSEAMERVIGGQVLDLGRQGRVIGSGDMESQLSDWEGMARGKTGALFGACFGCGAAAGGASSDEARRARDFGEELGLLFQVQDDYLDLVGDKGRGEVGRDLREGKWSYPVAWLLTHGDEEARRVLATTLDNREGEPGSELVASALSTLGESGALAATASWLVDRRDTLRSAPEALLVPDLLEVVLAPVAHAL